MTGVVRNIFLQSWKCTKILLTYGEVVGETNKDGDDGAGDERRSSESNSERKESRESQIENPKFNGSVTSLMMLGLLLTAVLFVFIAPFFNHDATQMVTKFFLIILMSLGTLILIKFTLNDDKVFLEPRKKHLGLRGRMILIGIMVFFVCGTFLDMFFIALNLHCLPVYMKCKGKVLEDNIVYLIFHVLRLVYLSGVTYFCCSYRGVRFKDGCLNRYGLMMLKVANMALWMDVIIRQICAKQNIMILPSYLNICNVSIEMTNHSILCLDVNNTVSRVTKGYGGDIVYPFLFQYSLLVFECFVQWFVYCGKARQNKQLVRNVVPIYFFNLGVSPTGSMETNKKRLGINPATMYYFIITFINTTYIVLNVLPKWVEEEDRASYELISSIFYTFYLSVNNIIIFVGYYSITAFNDSMKSKKFNSLNYLLIISAIGTYVYTVSAIEVVYFAEEQDLGQPMMLTVVKQIMLFLSVFCQIPFSFLASRVTSPTTDVNNFKVDCFKAVTLYLAVSNCILWLVGSSKGAFNTRMGNYNLHIKYFRTNGWLLLDTIVQPLFIFYRFNSFLLFIAARFGMNSVFSYRTQHID